MDINRVNISVKIKIAYDRLCGDGKPNIRRSNLGSDLSRLVKSMTTEEYNEYIKRIR